MNGRFLACAIALVLAGCSAGASPTSSPAVLTTPSAAADTPAPTTTLSPTASPEPTVAPEPTEEPARTYGPCPTTAVISVKEFVLADPACFETGDIEVRGWLDHSSPFGFEAPGVEPGWLWYPTDEAVTLWVDVPKGDDFSCNEDVDAWCYSFWLHVAPDSPLQLPPLKRWVILTGHTHDPAAESCIYDDGSGPNPDLVAACRSHFVVTAIRNAP